MRIGVLTDFGSADYAPRHRALVREIERRYPRDGIEQILA